MSSNPTFVDRGPDLYEIRYNDDSDKHFFMQVLTYGTKTTQIKATPLLDISQSTPTDWQSPEWVTDDTLTEEIEDPIGDLIISLLRLLGKRFNKPFGEVE